MEENNKKPLTNPSVSPKITPDAYWNCVKRLAKEQGYGTITIDFAVHDGQVRGAEHIASKKKLSPY